MKSGKGYAIETHVSPTCQKSSVSEVMGSESVHSIWNRVNVEWFSNMYIFCLYICFHDSDHVFIYQGSQSSCRTKRIGKTNQASLKGLTADHMHSIYLDQSQQTQAIEWANHNPNLTPTARVKRGKTHAASLFSFRCQLVEEMARDISANHKAQQDHSKVF